MAGQAEPVVPFASGNARAQRVILFLWLSVGVELFIIIADLLDVRMFARAVAGQPLTEADGNASNLRLMTVGLTQSVLYLVTGVLFFMWYHRAYRNLPALGARGLRWTPGGAIVSFFIPLMNLVRPLLATMDLWRASDPDATDWRRAPVSPLVIGWWIVWLTSNLMENAPAMTDRSSAPPDELLIVSWVGVAGAALCIVAAVLAIRVIQTINARQEQKSRQLLE